MTAPRYRIKGRAPVRPYRGEPWRPANKPSELTFGIYEGTRLIRECASSKDRDDTIAFHNRAIQEPLPAASELDDDSETALGPQGRGPLEENDD